MFKLLLSLIVGLVLIAFLRSVLSMIFKGFGEALQEGGRPSQPPQAVPTVGELRKDPVCGTYISTATAHQKYIRGETMYFCSQQCRDKYV